MSKKEFASFDFKKECDNIPPIEVTSQSQAFAEMQNLIESVNSEKEWDSRENGIRRGIALVNGGLLNFKNVHKDLIQLGFELVDCSNSLRSKLVKCSCTFLSLLAQKLGNDFDYMGDIIYPLSKKTSNGTWIISNSLKYTILTIIENCKTKNTLKSVLTLTKMNSPTNRKVGAEGLNIIMDKWENSFNDQQINDIKNAINKLINDSQPETRQIARKVESKFEQKYQCLGKKQNEIRYIQSPPIKRSFLPIKRKPNNESAFQRNTSAPKGYHKTLGNAEKIRRSKSPVPFGANKNRINDHVSLVSGNEDKFLLTIEEYIYADRKKELFESIETIVNGLNSILCMNNEINIKRAMIIIQKLLKLFPEQFTPILSQILKISFSSSEYTSILKDILIIFDPNLILFYIIHLQIIQKMVPYIVKLINKENIDLTQDNVCEPLVEIAFNFQEEEKKSAKEIIQLIYLKNPSFILNLDNKFVDSIVKSSIQYGKSIHKFVEEVGDEQWETDKEKLYDDIIEYIYRTDEKDLMFGLIMEILKKKNNDSYKHFLIVITTYLKDKRIPNSMKLFHYLLESIDNSIIIFDLIDLLNVKQEDFKVNRNLIDALTIVIKDGNEEQIHSQISKIMDVLSVFINDTNCMVRQSVVFCYVELLIKFNDEITQYFHQLNLAKQKLINFYKDRKINKNIQ